jgi:GDP-4-dehydro-6-deoxy-D-mannose reductase
VAPRSLVTGASGFVGRHLAAHLTERGHEVHGFGRRQPSGWDGPWHAGDLGDPRRLRAVVAQAEPDFVFHLAGLMRGELEELLAVNVVGTEQLLAAVRAERPEARVLVAGSAAEYGLAHEDELPITEHQPLRPVSPYGVAKVAQSLLAAQAALRQGLVVVRTRSFNLTGPGEPETLVCAAFARQLVEVERRTRAPILRVGNLESLRDFVDVRDAVRAYALVAESGTSGAVYNVASGRAVAIEDVLERLRALSGVDARIEEEPARRVVLDVPAQRGDATRLRVELGWTAEVDLETSLADLLEDWRLRVAGAS